MGNHFRDDDLGDGDAAHLSAQHILGRGLRIASSLKAGRDCRDVPDVDDKLLHFLMRFYRDEPRGDDWLERLLTTCPAHLRDMAGQPDG